MKIAFLHGPAIVMREHRNGPEAVTSRSVSRRKGHVHLFAGELAERLFRSSPSRVCVLAFYLDDSTDQKQERIYVAAGFLGRSSVWFEAERHWQAALEAEGLDYFRTNEAHTLSGEFKKLVAKHGEFRAAAIRDRLIADLWLIVKSSNLYGFCFLGPMPAYRTVQQEAYSEYVFQRDPYVHVHEHLIYQVAAWVCDHASKPVAFVFDEHNKAASLLERWSQMKAVSPKAAPCMGTLAPMDDRQCPAVQMGDLLANTAKRTFENQMHDPKVAFEKLRQTCGRFLTWVAAWNEDYLRALREASIDAATAPSIPFEFEAQLPEGL